jgi:phosphotransferase system enzyme I (PtsP)
MGGCDVTFRTLDIGGDKVIPYLNAKAEANPELGLRSIRFSLRYPDIFEQQLRAILRAGADASGLRIMFPMISSLDEFRQAKKCLGAAGVQLDSQGLAHHRSPQVGLMIELPAVLDIIADLAVEADFISIGTNDFIQYMLAVDRDNEKVAAYYQPGHPAVLRGLNRIVAAARQERKDIAVCGEMGHETDWIPFLIGVGLRSLSVDPQFLPLVQKTIGDFSLAESKAYADALLAQPTLEGIRTVVNEWRTGHFKQPREI